MWFSHKKSDLPIKNTYFSTTLHIIYEKWTFGVIDKYNGAFKTVSNSSSEQWSWSRELKISFLKLWFSQASPRDSSDLIKDGWPTIIWSIRLLHKGMKNNCIFLKLNTQVACKVKKQPDVKAEGMWGRNINVSVCINTHICPWLYICPSLTSKGEKRKEITSGRKWETLWKKFRFYFYTLILHFWLWNNANI